MSKTEAFEMISFRSRSSSSEVQAFALFSFFVSISPGASSFPGSRRRRLLCFGLGSSLAADGPHCLLYLRSRARREALQHILELHNQVSYKPLSQRVVGLGCKKPQLIKPMMNIFSRRVHLKASPESTKSGDAIMFPEVNNLVTSGGRRAVLPYGTRFSAASSRATSWRPPLRGIGSSNGRFQPQSGTGGPLRRLPIMRWYAQRRGRVGETNQAREIATEGWMNLANAGTR